MATIAPPAPAGLSFPKANVVKALTAELISIAINEAEIRGINLPKDPGKIAQASVPMDSLTVVDAICVIEPILKFELRDSTVRTGGYNSVQEALDHLIPRIERVWLKKKGQKNG